MVHLNSSFGRDRHCNSNYPLRIQKTRTSIRDNQRLLLVALLTCLNRTGFDARWYRYFADLSPKSPHPRQWVVNGGEVVNSPAASKELRRWRRFSGGNWFAPLSSCACGGLTGESIPAKPNVLFFSMRLPCTASCPSCSKRSVNETVQESEHGTPRRAAQIPVVE